MRKSFHLATLLGWIASSLYGIGLVILCLLIADEVLVWLRFGIWQTLLMKDVVALPHSDWIGVQKISDFFEEVPFAATACLVPIVLGWSIQKLADAFRANHKSRHLQRNWPPPL